jgi:hypothetical protein
MEGNAMTGKLQKRISKLITTPLRRSFSFKKQDSNAPRSITILCTSEHETKEILSQLQEVSRDRHVTSIVLQEMIQRPDNVQLFCKIQELLRSNSKSAFGGVTSIHLMEPNIHFNDYRRWCYKRTNFMQRVRKDAKERRIDIEIHGTLIFEASGNVSTGACEEQLGQNIASWLSLLHQLPRDSDITSLRVTLREEPIVCTARPAADNGTTIARKASQLQLLQSPVPKVFQALVELFNSDTRQWRRINCHVQYHPDDQSMNLRQQQTQSLMDVAELFDIPLQVQWQPIASANGSSKDAAVGWTRSSSTAEQWFPAASWAAQVAAVTVVKHDVDDTSTTFGSSAALMAN